MNWDLAKGGGESSEALPSWEVDLEGSEARECVQQLLRRDRTAMGECDLEGTGGCCQVLEKVLPQVACASHHQHSSSSLLLFHLLLFSYSIHSNFSIRIHSINYMPICRLSTVTINFYQKLH